MWSEKLVVLGADLYGPVTFACFNNTQTIPECFGACPNLCTLNGNCSNGFCDCNSGWQGDDCSGASLRSCALVFILLSLVILNQCSSRESMSRQLRWLPSRQLCERFLPMHFSICWFFLQWLYRFVFAYHGTSNLPPPQINSPPRRTELIGNQWCLVMQHIYFRVLTVAYSGVGLALAGILLVASAGIVMFVLFRFFVLTVSADTTSGTSFSEERSTTLQICLQMRWKCKFPCYLFSVHVNAHLHFVLQS